MSRLRRVLTRDDIDHSAVQTVDDLLRQVPGFSLFRRSSSLVTHPTTQGLSLRGIGPSGTSRALVLIDGVPANDPFGGWVYWGRMPMLGIDQIEVVRGGGRGIVPDLPRGQLLQHRRLEADSNHSTFNGRVELLATPEASFFVSGTPEAAAGRSAAASAHSTMANCASRPTPAESA